MTNICIFKGNIFRQSLPKSRLFWDRLIMLLLITVLPRARYQDSATAASRVTSSPLGGKPKGLFCCQPSTLAKSKASCLKLATDFYILIRSLEQEYKKNLSNTSGCCGTGDLSGKTSAEEGNKPAACSQYQLFSLPIKLAAHTNRQ